MGHASSPVDPSGGFHAHPKPAASMTSSNVRSPDRGALTSTAMLPGACWFFHISVVGVSADLLRRQVTLIGSWTFLTVGQAGCARFIAERGIPAERIFTHRWRLDEAGAAYRLFDTQTTGKGVIAPEA